MCRGRGVFGSLEAHLKVALGGEAADLARPHLLDDPNEVGAVGEVTVVELEADVRLVEVAVEMIDTPRVEGR